MMLKIYENMTKKDLQLELSKPTSPSTVSIEEG